MVSTITNIAKHSGLGVPSWSSYSNHCGSASHFFLIFLICQHHACVTNCCTVYKFHHRHSSLQEFGSIARTALLVTPLMIRTSSLHPNVLFSIYKAAWYPQSNPSCHICPSEWEGTDTTKLTRPNMVGPCHWGHNQKSLTVLIILPWIAQWIARLHQSWCVIHQCTEDHSASAN